MSVDTILGPGEYVILMVGGALFGATSIGTMPRNGTDLPGSAYFGRSNSGWDDGTLVSRNGARLVVEGLTAVPEPSSIVLVGFACIGFATARRRRRTAEREEPCGEKTLPHITR